MSNLLLVILLVSLAAIWIRSLLKRDWPITSEEKQDSEIGD